MERLSGFMPGATIEQRSIEDKVPYMTSGRSGVLLLYAQGIGWTIAW